MLVLMTLTHLPTRLSYPLGHTFGFVSAAEGFVLLSGFMAGLVYSQRGRRQGAAAMRHGLWRRAGVIYLCHLVLLLLLFGVFAGLAQRLGQLDVSNLIGHYLEDPRAAWLQALALLYQPALLDVLPMYVLFMLASPWLLCHALRHGWGGILAGSVLLWVAAQFGLGEALHALMMQGLGLPVRPEDSGSFVLPAWQFLWVLGLWMGAESASPQLQPPRFPRWMVHAAVLLATACFFWRHAVGHAPFGTDATLNLLFDKWHLGPLRLLNLLALMVVVMHFGPALRAVLPRPHGLETLGRASLSVFNAHLVIVLAVLTLFGGNPALRPPWADAMLLALCFLLLWAVARAVQARPAAAGGQPAAWPGRLTSGASR